MQVKSVRRIFQDMLFLMVMGFAAFTIWMLPHLNDPSRLDRAEPPGNVIAAITWPKGNIDVDLWVDGPGEREPVGYSNRNGLLWNLLRDDLGTSPDASSLNYENAYTRGIIPGEYVINVHCYRCSPYLPLDIEVEISVKTDKAGKAPMRVLAATVVHMEKEHQQETAVRFKLTKEGNIVSGTLNHVYKQLRSPGGGFGGGFGDGRLGNP